MASLLLGGPPMASQALYPHLSSKSQSLINLPTSYSPPATSPSSPALLIYCGRGDRKTAKGKRFNHSYGNSRPRNKNKGRGPPRVFAPPLPPRKDKYDDGQIIEIELDDDILDN